MASTRASGGIAPRIPSAAASSVDVGAMRWCVSIGSQSESESDASTALDSPGGSSPSSPSSAGSSLTSAGAVSTSNLYPRSASSASSSDMASTRDVKYTRAVAHRRWYAVRTAPRSTAGSSPTPPAPGSSFRSSPFDLPEIPGAAPVPGAGLHAPSTAALTSAAVTGYTIDPGVVPSAISVAISSTSASTSAAFTIGKSYCSLEWHAPARSARLRGRALARSPSAPLSAR